MVNGHYVIDAHCHIYPEKIAARAIAGTSAFYDIEFPNIGTVEDLIKCGKEAGYDHFIVQSVATTPKQVESINEFIASSVNENKDLMTGLGTLHPDCDNMQFQVEKIKSLGLRGVKLHPDIQQFKIDDYRCLKIYELCEREGLPILMHTGDSRYDYSNPNRLLPILQIYTSLTIVGAHLGGYSLWEEAAEKLKGIDNFYVDCSSSFPFIGNDRVKKLIETYGVDKVIFGTDYPMWELKNEIIDFFKMGFDEESCEKMLNGNARKVYID